MNNRYNYNLEQNKGQSYQNPIKSYEFNTREIKAAKYGIPRPIKQNQNESFLKTAVYKVNNNYYMPVKAENYVNNDKYRIKKVILNNEEYITETYPAPQTDRYNCNNRIIVYQKKRSGNQNYNNNTVHFIKHDSKNINNQYQTIDNKRNNHTFKISRGNTPKSNQDKKLYVNHSSKMLYQNQYTTDIKKTKEKIFDEEIASREVINKKTNYHIVNIKHQSNKELPNILNMITPNNTRIHTIIYTNKKNDKLKEIPIPKKLFSATEKKNYGNREIFSRERNIPKEINDYFVKNRIDYKDRSKYINSTLLIQTTFRQFLKKGKIKFNFIKKYVKFYRAINSIQALFNDKKKFWKYFTEKLEKYEAKKIIYNKRKVNNKIPYSKSKNINENEKMNEIFNNNAITEIKQDSSKPKVMLRSQSRDIVNVEKLIKEKEDLEKRLNQIMEENNMLKKINLSNKELLSKNIELTEKFDKTNEKTKKLEVENEKYLNEFTKTKDKYSKIENEVADVNMKLKITYLKFLLDKKIKKRKQILYKYFKKYKELSLKMKLIEEKNKNIKNSKMNMVNKFSTAIKNNNDELIKKRNKILLEILYHKDKERTRFLHSCFSKFYYKGMINQFKFRKSIMLDQLKIDNQKIIEEERKKEERRRKEEEEEKRKREEERLRLIYEEEERKRKEEEEKKMEEERKKREEEEKIKEEEKKKIEEQKMEEEKQRNENTKRLNKINMERRKKLKKLLQDEKKQKLDIKRKYFKIYHFKALLFSSHLLNKDKYKESISSNNNNEFKNEEEKKAKEKEDIELKNQKELEELNKKKLSLLQTIFYKKDRKITIIKKNILERWNLIAKLISLGPTKKLRGKSKKRGNSKKGKKNEEEKPKKLKNKLPVIKNLKNKEENDKNSEDEKDEKDKEDAKENEK